MERWFPSHDGEHSCSRVAEAAESRVNRNDRSRRWPDTDPVSVLLMLEPTPQHRTLQSAGVDAGGQNIDEPAMGEVSLDLPLHGKRFNLPKIDTVGKSPQSAQREDESRLVEDLPGSQRTSVFVLSTKHLQWVLEGPVRGSPCYLRQRSYEEGAREDT